MQQQKTANLPHMFKAKKFSASEGSFALLTLGSGWDFVPKLADLRGGTTEAIPRRKVGINFKP